MVKKIIASILLFSCCLIHVFGQTTITTQVYPKDYFRYPLDLPPKIVGSFAELRPNHFHSGLDFRTNQQEGYPVHAAAEGFVSRIRVQFGGFGNAVYITHPNGYTTVYGHLKSFSPELEALLRAYQAQVKTDLVDFNLLPLQVPVTKGQVVALSGSTGDAVGPHVHFEIRDTQTEQTINPQLFGLVIPDNIPPTLGTACIYHFNGAPFSEKTQREFLPVNGSAGHYHLAKPHVLNLSGEVAFGITANDINNTSPNHNGIYSIELKLDGKTIYTFAAERFAFDQTHAINAYIDFPEFLTSHRFIQKCFVLPGSKITLYPQAVNRGIISFTDDQLHDVEFVVKDVAGNTSNLALKVQSSSKGVTTPPYKPVVAFHYDKQNDFSAGNIKISIPAGDLYDDIDFTYGILPKKPGAYSATYQIHNRFTPLNDVYNLWIKPDSTIGKYAAKAVIISTTGACAGGVYEDGYIKAQPRAFGDFYVRVDSVPPGIRPLNIINGGSMKAKRAIDIRIGDNLSGVKSYMGYIDGKWVLMQWNNKTSILSYTFDDSLAAGKHTFELTVTDQKDNSSNYKADFYR